jgi:RND superfamily putative drug exporter
MLAIARFCSDHRRIVVALWVVVLVVVLGSWMTAGSRYANNFSLGNTDAQRAADLLRSSFPLQSGDRDQIVFHAPGGLGQPEVRSEVTKVAKRVAALPHVAAVTSPFDPGVKGQISADGKTGFAVVLFDQKANELPTGAINGVIDTAEAARSPELQVELAARRSSRRRLLRPGRSRVSASSLRSSCC